jgi:hypothetical protein
MSNRTAPFRLQRFVQAINAGTTDIQPFDVCEHVGTEFRGGLEEVVRVRQVAQPTHATAINGAMLLGANQYGMVTFTGPATANYNVSDGFPQAGEHWGTNPGSGALRRGVNHWIIIGNEDGRAIVERVKDQDVGAGWFYTLHEMPLFSFPPTDQWHEIPIIWGEAGDGGAGIPESPETWTVQSQRLIIHMAATWHLEVEERIFVPWTWSEESNAGCILVTPGGNTEVRLEVQWGNLVQHTFGAEAFQKEYRLRVRSNGQGSFLTLWNMKIRNSLRDEFGWRAKGKTRFLRMS